MRILYLPAWTIFSPPATAAVLHQCTPLNPFHLLPFCNASPQLLHTADTHTPPPTEDSSIMRFFALPVTIFAATAGSSCGKHTCPFPLIETKQGERNICFSMSAGVV